MQGEEWYRMALIAMLAGFLPFGIYHRAKAETGEPLRRRDEGLPIMISLRMCGLVGLLAILAYMIRPGSLSWSAVGLPAWARWSGLLVGLLAGVWWVWMFRTLGPNLTDTVTVRAGARLVTGGPYRWVRHPMYLAVAMMMLAVSLLTANAFMLLVGSLVVALLVARTPKEEAKLVERFGPAYLEYASRTGRFLPRLRRARPAPVGATP